MSRPKIEPSTLRIQIHPDARVESIGPYRPGIIYEVPRAQALHLIALKGFVEAAAPDAPVTSTEEAE